MDFDNFIDNMGDAPVVDEEALAEINDLPLIKMEDFNETEEPDYKNHVLNDYLMTRKTIAFTIEEAQKTLKDLRRNFLASENPKIATEIVKLLSVISVNSEKLFQIHQKIRDVIKPVEDEKAQSTTVVVASTNEILEAIQNNRKED